MTNIWIEVIKMGIIPLVLLLLGFFINRTLKRIEHFQWRNQKLIEKRLNIYDDLAPLFNDLLCYYTYVGSWKSYTPVEIVEMKRKIDKKFHLAAPLMSKEFYQECKIFMDLCYETYTGSGNDAKLRTDFKTERRKELFGDKWDSKWEVLFAANNVASLDEIRESYNKIMKVFTDDIGLSESISMKK